MNDFPGILNLMGSLNLVHCLHYMAFIRRTQKLKSKTLFFSSYTPCPDLLDPVGSLEQRVCLSITHHTLI